MQAAETTGKGPGGAALNAALHGGTLRRGPTREMGERAVEAGGTGFPGV